MTGSHFTSQVSFEVSPNQASNGAVFTRKWVVELILDLAGYTPDKDLASKVAVEPACGRGAFLVPMVDRLIKSCSDRGSDIAASVCAIRAFDIDEDAVSHARSVVRDQLMAGGVAESLAEQLVRSWVKTKDFLLESPEGASIDFLLGNPPYVRLESVDPERMMQYRERWQTMTGRADLYVGFLEAGLRALRPGGVLAVICADRWMRNQYGSALRRLVSGRYAVETVLVMHQVDAFEDRVSAYPAIIVLGHRAQEQVLVGEADDTFGPVGASEFREVVASGPGLVPETQSFTASWSVGWFDGSGSWPAGSPERLALIAELEQTMPALEDSGVKVGVGVATGADAIYVVSDRNTVEEERLLPTLAAREISSGSIEWRGRWLVNPWLDEGLVDLTRFPRMDTYLSDHKTELSRRHVAQRRPSQWWRTIDRVEAGLAATPKLLIPDLKDRIHPVLDEGKFYPLHSLYYMTSDLWDLRVLGGLLLSDIASSFVEAYSVRMANGYLRVSAQYLRRIHVPDLSTIRADVTRGLTKAFDLRDSTLANIWAPKAYGIATSGQIRRKAPTS